MDRGARWATVHWVTELDPTEQLTITTTTTIQLQQKNGARYGNLTYLIVRFLYFMRYELVE